MTSTAAGAEELATPTDIAQRMRDKLDAGFPDAWIASDTDREIIGAFLRLEKGNTRFGTAWIVVLADVITGTERAVWLVHTVLRNEFKRAQPKQGEIVAVRYEGMKQPEGTGAPYASYKVAVDRPTTEASWAELPDDGSFAAPVEGDFVGDPDDEAAMDRPRDDIPF